jgi:hypothetical protein
MSRESRINQAVRLVKERERLARQRDGVSSEVRQLKGQLAETETRLAEVEAQLVEVEAQLGDLVGDDADTTVAASETTPALSTTDAASVDTSVTLVDDEGGVQDHSHQLGSLYRSPTMGDRIRHVFHTEPRRLFTANDVQSALSRDGFGSVGADSIRVTLMRLYKDNTLLRPQHGRYQWAGSVSRSNGVARAAVNGESKLTAVNGTATVGTEEEL